MKASRESIAHHIREIKKFVRVYNTSKTFKEVLRRTGLKINAASTKAALYRLRGVPLKRFGHSTAQKEIDWVKIAHYARQF